MHNASETGHHPTEEEDAKAEALMTPLQKRLNEERPDRKAQEARDAYYKLKEEMKFDFDTDLIVDNDKIEGRIGGYRVSISRDGANFERSGRTYTTSNIDGDQADKESERQLVEQLWQRYYAIAKARRDAGDKFFDSVVSADDAMDEVHREARLHAEQQAEARKKEEEGLDRRDPSRVATRQQEAAEEDRAREEEKRTKEAELAAERIKRASEGRRIAKELLGESEE